MPSKPSLKTYLIGNPLELRELAHERLGKIQALAVFSSDAISSSAYATDEIIIALTAISATALDWSLPIALSICVLLLILITSYRQTIHAYPNGGGAYIVAKDNLGETLGLVAGASLLVDYVLTVAVSISAGIQAVTSAFPSLAQHAVLLCLISMVVLVVGNLRGIRESAKIFALPTYIFVGSIYILIAIGLYKYFQNEIAIPSQGINGLKFQFESIGILFLLRAFSSGCTALTGVEAVSNGVTAFRKPESHNAVVTLMWMAFILGSLFVGITVLAHLFHITPSDSETVISQIARVVFGETWFYYVIQGATMLILVLAANTAFNDFPRLSSILANDRYLPRQLSNLGDRLVFSNGILALGGLASLLIIAFNGDTHLLIPLYAVGVFVSFTLSQSGMVVRMLFKAEHRDISSAIINGIGAVTTFVVLCIVVITKFIHGAWLIVILIPIIVVALKKIHSHYMTLGDQLKTHHNDYIDIAQPVESMVIIPVSGLHKGLVRAIRFAHTISKDISAVYIDLNPENTKRLQMEWEAINCGVELTVLDSPYRSLSEPFLKFVATRIYEAKKTRKEVIILIPEFVAAKWWHHFLHNQTASLIRTFLWFRYPELVVTSVRHRLRY